MRYANAAKIFPKPLLDEMRRHFPDGLLWVPRRDDHRPERNDLIVHLVENGEPVKEVAALAKLTPRHIYRLVRECKQKRSPDDRKPEDTSAVSSIRNKEGDDPQ